MILDEDKEKREAHPEKSRGCPSEIKKLIEPEEPSIDVLQWYLKMIIDS